MHIWGTLEDCFTGLVTRSFRTWSQFNKWKCCLGTVSSPGRDTAPCVRLPLFLPGDLAGLHMERLLVLFVLQFSLVVLCGICDGFYFTFNQKVVMKSHLRNKTKCVCLLELEWGHTYEWINELGNCIKLMESFSEAELFCTISSEYRYCSFLVFIGRWIKLQGTFRFCSNLWQK